jgi:hypothetical protein
MRAAFLKTLLALVAAVLLVLGLTSWVSVGLHIGDHLYRCNVRDVLIVRAVYLGHAAEARKLIRGGADVNAIVQVSWWTERLIHMASLEGYVDVVQALIDGGADVNARDTCGGRTPILRMAEEPFRDNYAPITERLVRAGASLKIANGDGWLPLHVCAMWDNVPYASVLLRLGAEVNAFDHNGETALIYTCSSFNRPPCEAMIRLLVEHGADISLPDPKGDTPFKILEKNGFLRFLPKGSTKASKPRNLGGTATGG